MGSKTITISTTANDMWGDHDGSFDTTGTFMWIGGTNVTGANPVAWIPFPNIPLSKSKVITSATIFWIASLSNTQSPAEFYLGCEAADNPATPTNNADLLARTMTTAYSTVTPVNYVQGTQYSYDVTASVQEIVNRTGWVAGNTLAILVTDVIQGNVNRRQIASFENATYTEPILQIVVPYFVPPSGGVF